jgi:hypothetical protein
MNNINTIKCYICGHVFGDHEVIWASSIMETLCDICHTEYLSPPLNEEERQMRKHPLRESHALSSDS